MQEAENEVVYNGQRILKHQFRAFIYGHEGQKKLVNSWDEFEAHLSTSLWFKSHEDSIPTPTKKKHSKDSSDAGE